MKGTDIEEVAETIGHMRKRLEDGQGTMASAMCRLPLYMAEFLLNIAKPKWTEGPPTEPGHYWVVTIEDYGPDGPIEQVIYLAEVMAYVDERGELVQAEYAYGISPSRIEISRITHHYPLPYPQEPEGWDDWAYKKRQSEPSTDS